MAEPPRVNEAKSDLSLSAGFHLSSTKSSVTHDPPVVPAPMGASPPGWARQLVRPFMDSVLPVHVGEVVRTSPCGTLETQARPITSDPRKCPVAVGGRRRRTGEQPDDYLAGAGAGAAPSSRSRAGRGHPCGDGSVPACPRAVRPGGAGGKGPGGGGRHPHHATGHLR